MKLWIDFKNEVVKRVGPYVIVCIARGNKGRITYNSGLLYFHNKEVADWFIEEVKRKSPLLEVKVVDVREAHEPTGEGTKGYWCPYCQSWEYWQSDAGGYKRCPVCKMSDMDFYVRKFNHLWSNDMKSKSAKKKSDNMQAKIKRKKRKENKE